MDILETDDGKWDGTLRAFWRRIQGYSKCKFNDIKELPEKMPVEFRAHFATALIASPIKSTMEAMTETAKYASARAILDHNEITALRARVAELESGELTVPYVEVVDALVGMAWQYLEDIHGKIDHGFMSAGENAECVLNRLGLIQDNEIIEKAKNELQGTDWKPPEQKK